MFASTLAWLESLNRYLDSHVEITQACAKAALKPGSQPRTRD